MGWVVFIAALAMLYVFNKRVNPRRGQNAVAVATMLLAGIAGCGMAFTFVGRWLAAIVSWAGRIAANLANEPGVALAVSIGVTLLMAGIAVADISFDKRADKGAQFAALLMPTLLAVVIGGSLGHTGGDAVRTVNTSVASFVTQLGGR